MKEQWKDIKDYEGHYKISNLGRVKNVKRNNNRYNKLLKLKKGTDKYKYYHISLFKNGLCKEVSIHRLVAQAFIPNPDNKPEVNHIDGNKVNNKIDNLEWCTHKENFKHASKNGLLINCGRKKGKIMKDLKSILLNLELKKYNQVRTYAFKNKTTISNVIREAINKFFNK